MSYRRIVRLVDYFDQNVLYSSFEQSEMREVVYNTLENSFRGWIYTLLMPYLEVTMDDISELIEKHEYGKTYSRSFSEMLLIFFLNSIQFSLPEVKIDHEGMFLQSGIFKLGRTRLSKRDLQNLFNIYINEDDSLIKIKNMLDEWDKLYI